MAIVRHYMPERLLYFRRTGLAAAAAGIALEMSIPSQGYWPETKQFGERAIDIAAHQMVTLEHPDLAICISPRDADLKALAALKARGVNCAIGQFDKAREVSWARL